MITKATLSKTVELAQALIAKASVTPDDAGCQALIAKRLTAMGFEVIQLPFGKVSNLWARLGTTAPLFAFAGHTDVVPPGPLEQWTSPPFEPTIRNSFLYGRGAADMKSSIAAMIVACENFLSEHPDFKGSIGFLITSDEEGPAVDGTVKVVDYLNNHGILIDYCIVGEASSQQKLGDTIKIGRRGSLNGTLTIHGKQGHIAYPQKAENPIHKAMAALETLATTLWDNGSEYFDPTSLQFSNIQAGTGADNVIPNELTATFNFRYSPALTADQLKNQVEAILNKHQLNYDLQWRHSASPFLTKPGKFTEICQQVIKEQRDTTVALSTSGGTSDARFIAPTGCEVLELGPSNASIHQIDEHISIDELNQLTTIYTHILRTCLISLVSAAKSVGF